MDNNNKNIGLSDRVKSGYSWTLAGNAIGQPISFIFGVILARILSPTDFGIIASCVVFIEVGNTLVAASYTSGLIQKKDIEKKDLSTGFILQLLTSVFILSCIIAISFIAAKIMKNPMVQPVLSVLSINFILLAFRGMPTVLVQRELNFQLLAKIGLAEKVCFGIVASMAAFMGSGVWSLVVGTLTARALHTLIILYYSGWRPSLQFDKVSAISILKISARFAVKDILDELARNVGFFLVGWRLGVRSLGFYSRAYNLMTLPVTNFSKSLENVLFPAFSQIQDDKERLKSGLLKSSAIIAMTTFPILIGLSLTAPIFIPVIYGIKWLPTVVPLQIICIAGLFYAIDSPVVSLINAKAFLTEEIIRQVIHLSLLVLGVLLGSFWGLEGAAWGVTLAASVYWFLLLQLLKNRMNLSWSQYLLSFIPAIIASSVMALTVLIFKNYLFFIHKSNDIIVLVGSIFIGAVIYFIMLVILRTVLKNTPLKEAFRDIDQFVLKNWSKISVIGRGKEKLQKY